MELNSIVCGDAFTIIDSAINEMREGGVEPVIVTDPPFNIGYHYKEFRDRIPEKEYLKKLADITNKIPSVVVHYPDMLHKLSIAKGEAPNRVVSWVYPSNTAKQHRDIAFYGIDTDFKKVKQPYRNPNDKRIQALMAKGKGARLYDWWEVNQVKNVSKEKTDHPCQMPLEVMKRVVGILPDGIGIIDPFCGAGTTVVACSLLGVPFIGIDIVKDYCDISARRLKEVFHETD